MGTAIMILVLAVIIVVAIISSRKHFKGQGGCCGGNADKSEKKKLDHMIARKIVHIEGMHCENCKNRIERQINRIDDAAAEVQLKKNIAIVTLSDPISDDVLIQAIERLDFHVTSVDTEEV